MGIDISGGMLIGNQVTDQILREVDATEHQCLHEYADQHDMVVFSPWYDAEYAECCIGFGVADVKVLEINQAWLDTSREKAEKFKAITGVEAMLIGMQDVY